MTATQVPTRRRTPGILKAVALGLSLGLVFIVAGLALLLIVVPKATGSTPLTILTQSMEPKLPPGTLIVVRPTAVSKIRVGDVVTYQIVSGQPAVISHRVISISASSNGSRTFVLKGDNNAMADSNPVKPVQIRGTLWYSLPYVGYVNQLVNGYARTWIIPAIAFVLFGYAAVMIALGIVSGARKRRRQRRAAHGRRSAAG